MKYVTRINFLKALQHNAILCSVLSIEDFEDLWQKMDGAYTGVVYLPHILMLLYQAKATMLATANPNERQSLSEVQDALIECAKLAAKGDVSKVNPPLSSSRLPRPSSFPIQSIHTESVETSEHLEPSEGSEACDSVHAVKCGKPAEPLPLPSTSSSYNLMTYMGQKVVNLAVDTKDNLQEKVHQRLMGYIDRMLDEVAQKLKQSMKDPDMPFFLTDCINFLVDNCMPDIKLEVYKKTEQYFVPNSTQLQKKLNGNFSSFVPPTHCTKAMNPTNSMNCTQSSSIRSIIQCITQQKNKGRLETMKEEPLENHMRHSRFSCLSCLFFFRYFQKIRRIVPYHLYMCRAFLLYQLNPYNKSYWNNVKNPYWMACQLVGVLPFIGQLWWILLYFLHDKRNEHLLCQYLISFKTAQFVTIGCWNTLWGVYLYLKCTCLTDPTDISTCIIESSPTLRFWDLCFFVLQILLVFLTFLLLPYSGRTTNKAQKQLRRCVNLILTEEENVSHDLFGHIIYLNRGGHLRKLYYYDALMLLITIAISLTIKNLHYAKWQEHAFLYWTRTSYGLCMLPFLVFRVPLLGHLLLRTRTTGYDEWGNTIPCQKMIQTNLPRTENTVAREEEKKVEEREKGEIGDPRRKEEKEENEEKEEKETEKENVKHNLNEEKKNR